MSDEVKETMIPPGSPVLELKPFTEEEKAAILSEEPKEKFSDIVYEHAQETAKIAEENPDALKIENQSAAEQVEFASRYFQMYNKVFVNMISAMNKKAAARVITRLVSYPLETPTNMTWNSKQEKDAFLIGNQLIETKYMLFKYVAMGEAEKAKLAQEPKVSEDATNQSDKV